MLYAEVTQHNCIAMMPVFFIEQELISGQLVPVLPSLTVSSAAIYGLLPEVFVRTHEGSHLHQQPSQQVWELPAVGEAAAGETPGIRQSSGPVARDTTLTAIGKPKPGQTRPKPAQTRPDQARPLGQILLFQSSSHAFDLIELHFRT